jgi:hypothetical protein
MEDRNPYLDTKPTPQWQIIAIVMVANVLLALIFGFWF